MTPDQPLRIVIVGGGPVAARLVQELRPALERGAVRVWVLGEEPLPAYQRIRLGDVASGRIDGADLALIDPADENRDGVEILCGAAVVSLDRDRRAVTLAGGAEVGYDRLVLATGASALIPDFRVSGTKGRGISVALGAGACPEGVIALRTMQEAHRLREAARSGEPVAVLGGGVLGVEVALALAEVGAEVSLLYRGQTPLGRHLDADAGRLLHRQLVDAGVQVRPDCGIQELVVAARAQDRATDRDGVPYLTALRTTHGHRIPATLLVACTGVRPRDELAAAAGLDTLPRGGIVVDRTGRCPEDAAVFAVGDCASPLGARPSGLIGPGWEQARIAALALCREAGHAGDVDLDAAGRPVPVPPSAPPGQRLEPTIVKSHSLSVACAGDPSVDPALDPWDARGPHVSTWADPASGQYLRIVSEGERLLGFVAIGLPRTAAELSRHAGTGTLPVADRSALLAMEYAAGDLELGPEDVLCRCSGATFGQVEEAAADSTTVDEVGRRCGAGTGCGTCREKIGALLADRPVRQPADSPA